MTNSKKVIIGALLLHALVLYFMFYPTFNAEPKKVEFPTTRTIIASKIADVEGHIKSYPDFQQLSPTWWVRYDKKMNQCLYIKLDDPGIKTNLADQTLTWADLTFACGNMYSGKLSHK